MALVILSSLFNASIYVLFKVFGKRHVALLPALVVNYLVAFLFGMAWSQPWSTDLSLLWLPALIEGVLFITLFRLMGLSTQWNGIAPTTIAAKMSLALTVLGTVLLFGEQPGTLAWIGISLALAGVLLGSWGDKSMPGQRRWALPVIFFASALTDLLLAVVQRVRLTPLTETAFAPLIFGFAALIGFGWLVFRPERVALREPRTWAGGGLLGLLNYGSIHCLVLGLSRSGLGASTVFPLANVAVILFGAAASVLLFRERLRPVHWAGIAVSVASLFLLINAAT
ncbi:MAG: DMT family transporter [Flavobacteriales bacterium]|nr:DMT family transporter [Flavobacteriales bacterium]HRO38613.1 DMT family transporter [Flavobacteriales bacterium]HRP81579.1 DMT family transporter [Flavobacteriales bacterium]